MRLSYQGSTIIPAPPDQVWDFLTNLQRVGRCVPDLQEMAVVDDGRLEAVVKVGVGPVRGPFRVQAQMTRDDQVRAASLVIRGSGMGSGIELSTAMRLEPSEDGTTVMRWEAQGVVTGPLAGVGSRLLDYQARRTVESIFDNIRKTFEAGGQAVPA